MFRLALDRSRLGKAARFTVSIRFMLITLRIRYFVSNERLFTSALQDLVRVAHVEKTFVERMALIPHVRVDVNDNLYPTTEHRSHFLKKVCRGADKGLHEFWGS